MMQQATGNKQPAAFRIILGILIVSACAQVALAQYGTQGCQCSMKTGDLLLLCHNKILISC